MTSASFKPVSSSLSAAMTDGDRDLIIYSTSGKTIREAITLEFGSDALRVLRESQAWFRERVRRFLKEGGDPAF